MPYEYQIRSSGATDGMPRQARRCDREEASRSPFSRLVARYTPSAEASRQGVSFGIPV